MDCFAQTQLNQTTKKEKELNRAMKGVQRHNKESFLLLIHPRMMLTSPPDVTPSSQTLSILLPPNRRTCPSSVLGTHRHPIQKDA
jgi:hypothetical protein